MRVTIQAVSMTDLLLYTRRALREMLHSAESNLSMNVLQADATTQVPTESLTDCVVDCGGGDPLLTSSGGVMKAIDDSVSNPRGTIALFIILVLCGMTILCWLSRRRQTPDVSSYIYVSPSS